LFFNFTRSSAYLRVLCQ